ncbi:MAG: aspartate kinase [Gemmatimonadaceae bacterium]|nr:aspartate kinase [Chitinophagaceae bacterium]
MQVFKFGGASVNSLERIKTVSDILRGFQKEKLLIVISAMGKTTNALEKVADAFFSGDNQSALALFEQIKNQHLTTAKYLLVKNYLACESQLRDIFTEAEWLLHDKPVRIFDYYYDQIVCIGELLSTIIMSHYLNEEGISNAWLDVRDIIRTDDNFRDANIDWSQTAKNLEMALFTTDQSVNHIITQGFIGATAENESVTLGREGSDYTAAVFANLLGAGSVSIWKDVEGVMNADPRQFPDAKLIGELNYDEVIEMAYYGAQVIHPKTIKPLQNKSIPLYVKCFLNASLPGTVIHNRPVKALPPIIVIKEKQALVHLHTQDFSFIGEKPISDVYQILAQLHIKPNLIQTGAVSLTLCLDDHAEKIDLLAAQAAANFDVTVEKGLELLSIRHYNGDVLERLSEGKKVILKQQSEETVQMVFRT